MAFDLGTACKLTSPDHYPFLKSPLPSPGELTKWETQWRRGRDYVLLSLPRLQITQTRDSEEVRGGAGNSLCIPFSCLLSITWCGTMGRVRIFFTRILMANSRDVITRWRLRLPSSLTVFGINESISWLGAEGGLHSSYFASKTKVSIFPMNPFRPSEGVRTFGGYVWLRVLTSGVAWNVVLLVIGWKIISIHQCNLVLTFVTTTFYYLCSENNGDQQRRNLSCGLSDYHRPPQLLSKLYAVSFTWFWSVPQPIGLFNLLSFHFQH